MKGQCDNHGCSELLCGCPVEVLESSKPISEIVRAKDKWINELLKENEKLIQANKVLMEELVAIDSHGCLSGDCPHYRASECCVAIRAFLRESIKARQAIKEVKEVINE